MKRTLCARWWLVLTFVAGLRLATSLPENCPADDKFVAKAEDAELARRKTSLAEIKIREALADPTTLEFIETPLKDVVDYLKDLHGIEIQIDSKALDGVGVSTDTPVTRNLKGVTLRSALTIILRDLELTFLIRDEVLQITTPDVVAGDVSVKTFLAADLVTDEAATVALTRVVEMALDPPARPSKEDKSPPQGPRAAIFRGLLLVRANPHEHERVEELLSQIRRQLKLPEKQAAHPLDDWPDVHVDLRGIRLRKDDLAHLKDQPHLRGLQLDSNRIGDEGLAHLRGLVGLESLSLGRNGLTDAGCAHLAPLVKLTSLNLSDGRITDKGLAHLKDLRELRRLNLTRTDVGDEGLAQLANLTRLESLELAKTAVTAKGLLHLKKLERLAVLSLSDTRVDSLKALPELPQLSRLDLSRTGIKDGDLEHLAKFKKLTALDLQGISVSDMGLEYLARQSNLRSLTLGGSSQSLVSHEALEKLRKALPQCAVAVSPDPETRDPFGGAPVAPDPFRRAPIIDDPFGEVDPFR